MKKRNKNQLITTTRSITMYFCTLEPEGRIRLKCLVKKKQLKQLSEYYIYKRQFFFQAICCSYSVILKGHELENTSGHKAHAKNCYLIPILT